MCGIFGYLNYNHPVTREEVLRFLVQGLRRLEYRGYDSAGISIDDPAGKKPELFRMKGNVSELEKLTLSAESPKKVIDNHVAISHTRWATHGEPSERNSHPQRSDVNNEFVVVHNGIITNYNPLKQMLISKGHVFESETDTEVIVKLAKFLYDKDPQRSFRKLITETAHLLDGAFAIIMKSSHYPGEAVAVKRGSPLLLGIKTSQARKNRVLKVIPTRVQSIKNLNQDSDEPDGSTGQASNSVEYFLASDGTAIVEHTKDVVYLEDNDIVHFSEGSFALYSSDRDEETSRDIKTLEVELSQIEKGEFEHYMMKEIFEQKDTVLEAMRGRLDFDKNTAKLGGILGRLEDIKRSNRIVFIACGTSYHAAVASRAVVEELAKMPVTLELASDFLDREPAIFRNDTCVFISQSGETADTLMALEYCKKHHALCVGITNTVGSAIARSTDCGIYLNCGPEIGVASTKAYTSQIVAIILFALQLGDDSIATVERRKEIIQGLKTLPQFVSRTLALDPVIKAAAEKLYQNNSLLIMGRGYQFATCLEAALKIKEICYIHCEGIMSGELKHGPLALIDDAMPIIFFATKDRFYGRTSDAFRQVTARKGQPIVVCSEGDDTIPDEFMKIQVPTTVDCLQAIVNIIPMQLLSYHVAVLRGCNVDKPRNLAKSVTVL